uniref:NADH-ubiquinone oxidoreductase chain 2 n=1 Tax=Siphonodentalium lobatum TaxID=203167 RepID=Q6VEI2_9MOLL|nr:NADH dehydrogenase subunit 2 [Siphonodentalium lobatum]AAP91666.1 NADH dehydrogenase subunit 2 [Siphonodentalium lobatum]
MIPSTFLMFSMMIVGALLSLSSSSWVVIWLGLELNMLAVLPMMGKFRAGGEVQLKYFVVQSLGSCLLMIGAVNKILLKWMVDLMGSNFILGLGLLVKLGVFPGHFWVPYVVGNSSWGMAFILSSWQKIAPSVLLVSMISPWVVVCAIMTSVIGAINGINQSDYRALLASSSLVHMGWVLVILSNSLSRVLMYMLVYFMVLSMVFFVLSSMSSSKMTAKTSYPVWLQFLSLAGMPPLMGFIPKFIGIETISFSGGGLMIIGLLLSASSISLYFYLRIVTNKLLGLAVGSEKSFHYINLFQLLGGVLLITWCCLLLV